MKSKLFLSLSFLTGLFSMNVATCSVPYVIPTMFIDGKRVRVFGPAQKAVFEETAKASKLAQFASHPTTQHAALAAGTLVLGTAVAGATVYGAQKAYNYMQPKQEVQPTRFERVKSAFSNGCASVKATAVKGYNLALTNKGTTAGAVAAVAGLGLIAYKYSDSIFGNSRAEAPSVAAKVETQANVNVFTPRKHLRD